MTHFDALTQRVRDRYLLRSAKSLGDPKQLCAQFEAVVRKYLIPESDLTFARKVFLENPKAEFGSNRGEPWPPDFQKAQDLARTAGMYTKYKSSEVVDAGNALFLALIQQYSLPPALRKKIEGAAKAYAKYYNPRSLRTLNLSEMYLKEIENYEKFLIPALKHLELAREALAKGELHSDGGGESPAAPTKVKVGDFTVVNTGGFSETTMGEIIDLTHKAQALLKSSGFGKVCYGEVLVTNTVGKSKWAAFYQVSSDELFIRANVKDTKEILRTTLHELGHRYQFQFMKGRDAEIRSFYRRMEGEEDKNLFDKLKGLKPNKGDTAPYKGDTLVVDSVEMSLRGDVSYKVKCSLQGDDKSTFSMPLETWLGLKGVKTRDPDDHELRGFITNYAKTGGPDENFAEMFSFYCLGKMRKEYRDAFEALVFGSTKTAHEHSTQRVAARWILEG